MITTKNFTTLYGYVVTVKYPTGTIFMRERNYLTVSCDTDDYYLKRITLAGKTINFGRYLLYGNPMTLDVTPYYAKMYKKSGTILLVVENQDEVDETFTIDFDIDKVDGYSPFLEFVPERCGDAQYARILPPNRMLWDGKKETSSLLSAMRDGDYFSGYEYEMESVPYENFRPSNAWVTTSQKNAHLGETYRNTLKSNGNLAELDGNGNPLWIERGDLYSGGGYIGRTFEQQRMSSTTACRAKTIFENYNGLVIGTPPSGIQMLVVLYDANKIHRSLVMWTTSSVMLNNASTYPYISLVFKKTDVSSIAPSELVGITSTELTNPDAGKSWRWYNIRGTYKWYELTQEKLVNNKFYWSVNNKSYGNDIVNKGFAFGSKFSAKLIRSKNITSPTSWTPLSTIYSTDRSVELVDGAMHYLYARWLTPWGISVEHLFYLDTYATDKDDAQEVESEHLYEERSKHIIKGSFYLDNIRDPYDLWYYQTLANSELVELYFPIFSVRKDIYMPNASDYVAVKITGSNIKDAVVDGVAQSTITFKFELS